MNIKVLRNLCKRESDYFFTILVTNELSLMLTWALMKTRLSPNIVTAASIVSGCLCGICYAFGNFWVGSGFLFLAHILDCTDGNLARAANRFSPIGKWLDMIGDRISHSFVLVGVSVYFFNSLDSILWTYLALLDAILILNYYYAVDIAIANKLYTTKNTEHRLKLKGVPIRFGLYEPIIYGFVFLAPIGMIKLHIGLIFISVFFGLSFQFYKKLKYAADYGNITP